MSPPNRFYSSEIGSNWSHDALFIDSLQNQSFFKSVKYAIILKSVYGYNSRIFICADPGGKFQGYCVLTRLNISSKSYFALPFCGQADPLVCNSETVKKDLLEYICSWLKESNSSCILPTIVGKLSDTDHSDAFAYLSLDIRNGITETWNNKISSKARNLIRRSEKYDFVFEVGGIDKLESFYNIHVETMKRIGSPAHKKQFYLDLIRSSDNIIISTVSLSGKIVSSFMSICEDNAMKNIWAGSLHKYNHFCPNYFHYWSLIKYSIENNLTSFEFGRSIFNSNHHKFKLQWGCTTSGLVYVDPLTHKTVNKYKKSNLTIVICSYIFKKIPKFLYPILTPISYKFIN